MEEKTTSQKIWNYLKEHQTITIAIGSAIIAIISFLLKNSVYLRDKLYLSYFGIYGVDIIDINDKQLYSVFWSLFFQLTLAVASILMLDFTDTFYVNRNIIKEKYNELKASSRAYKKVKNELSALSEKEREEFDKRNPQSNELPIKIKNTKKMCRKTARINRIQLVVQFLFIEFVMLIASCPVSVLLSRTLRDSINSIVAFLALPVLLQSAGLILEGRARRKNKDFKSPISNETYDGETSKEYLLFRFFKDGIVKTVKSVKWRFIFNHVLLTMFIFLIGFSVSGHYSAKSARQFNVFEENGYSYAIIYENGQSLVAEKIEIDEQKAVIHKNEQIIKTKDNITIKSFKFDTVELIDN